MLRQVLVDGSALIDLEVGGQDAARDRQGPAAAPRARRGHAHRPARGAPRREDPDRGRECTSRAREEAPGVKEGGVLEHVTHQLNIEALPTAIPDYVAVDVSGMEIAGTMHLSEVTAPEGVTFLDDPEETLIATVVVPTEVEEPEIEEETELVGEDGEPTRARPAEGAEGAEEGEARRGGRGLLSLFRRSGGGEAGQGRLAGGRTRESRATATPRTRHNVGFEVAALAAERWGLPRAKKSTRASTPTAAPGPGGPRVGVLLPQTYMNDSGGAVRPGARRARRRRSTTWWWCTTRSTCPSAASSRGWAAGSPATTGSSRSSVASAARDFRRVRVGVGRPGHDRPGDRLRARAGPLQRAAGRGARAGRARRRRARPAGHRGGLEHVAPAVHQQGRGREQQCPARQHQPRGKRIEHVVRRVPAEAADGAAGGVRRHVLGHQ